MIHTIGIDSIKGVHRTKISPLERASLAGDIVLIIRLVVKHLIFELQNVSIGYLDDKHAVATTPVLAPFLRQTCIRDPF
jgi:hypothetical protein